MDFFVDTHVIKICQSLCFRYKSVTLLITDSFTRCAPNFSTNAEFQLLSSNSSFPILTLKRDEIAGAMKAYHYLNFHCEDTIASKRSRLYFLYVIYS